MNISGFISGLKQKARDRETKKNVAVAKTLKSLKEERTRLEGQKKIYDLQAKEKARIAAAKSDLKKQRMQNSFFGKVGVAVEKVKSDKGKMKEAPSFAKSGSDLFSNVGGKSPFSLRK